MHTSHCGPKTCEKLLDDLYRELNKAMKDNIPKTKTKLIGKNNPWWIDSLQLERKELCKLHKTSLRHPTDRNKERYRVKHAECKQHCDKTKKISWADYKEKINSVEAENTFRKSIESSTRHTLSTLERADGTITKPGADTLEYLLTQHFPSSTSVKPTKYSHKSITREEINAFQPDWVTPEKVREAFHGFQSKKYPGTD